MRPQWTPNVLAATVFIVTGLGLLGLVQGRGAFFGRPVGYYGDKWAPLFSSGGQKAQGKKRATFASSGFGIGLGKGLSIGYGVGLLQTPSGRLSSSSLARLPDSRRRPLKCSFVNLTMSYKVSNYVQEFRVEESEEECLPWQDVCFAYLAVTEANFSIFNRQQRIIRTVPLYQLSLQKGCAEYSEVALVSHTGKRFETQEGACWATGMWSGFLQETWSNQTKAVSGQTTPWTDDIFDSDCRNPGSMAPAEGPDLEAAVEHLLHHRAKSPGCYQNATGTDHLPKWIDFRIYCADQSFYNSTNICQDAAASIQPADARYEVVVIRARSSWFLSEVCVASPGQNNSIAKVTSGDVIKICRSSVASGARPDPPSDSFGSEMSQKLLLLAEFDSILNGAKTPIRWDSEACFCTRSLCNTCQRPHPSIVTKALIISVALVRGIPGMF